MFYVAVPWINSDNDIMPNGSVRAGAVGPGPLHLSWNNKIGSNEITKSKERFRRAFSLTLFGNYLWINCQVRSRFFIFS